MPSSHKRDEPRVTNPFTTLFELTDQIQELDMVQSWIDHARNAAPTNQHVQLELNRQQFDIHRKRALIAQIMLDISSRN